MKNKLLCYGLFWLCLFCMWGCITQDLSKGNACLALGDYPLAIRFFTQGIEKDPLNYQARLGLGKALIQKSIAEFDSLAFAYALIQLEAARNLRPSANLDSLLGGAYLERARTQLHQGDTGSALRAAVHSLDYNPKEIATLNLAGIIYAKLGELDKAKILFQKILVFDSGSASAHFNLGLIAWQGSEIYQAHEHWLLALKALPQDEDILYWFAQSEKRIRENP